MLKIEKHKGASKDMFVTHLASKSMTGIFIGFRLRAYDRVRQRLGQPQLC